MVRLGLLRGATGSPTGSPTDVGSDAVESNSEGNSAESLKSGNCASSSDSD